MLIDTYTSPPTYDNSYSVDLFANIADPYNTWGTIIYDHINVDPN